MLFSLLRFKEGNRKMKKTARYFLVNLLVVIFVGVVPWSAMAVPPGAAINKSDTAAKSKTVSLPPPVAPVISLWPTLPSMLKVVLNIKYDSPDKDGITGFMVERAQKLGDPRERGPLAFAKVAQLGPGERTWSESVPESSDHIYYYRVIALGPTQIRSWPSNEVAYECLPLAPADLKAELLHNSAYPVVKLTWTNRSKIASYIKIYSSEPIINNGQTVFIAELQSNQNVLNVSTGPVDVGQTKTFWVKANTISHRESVESNRVSVLIK
jgi:hypothetical protein